MKTYIFSTIAFVLFFNTISAQNKDKVTVMSKITCECINNISEEIWKSNPQEEIKDCFNAAVLGGLLSMIQVNTSKKSDSIVVELRNNKVSSGNLEIGEIDEKDLELTRQQLRKNCPRYNSLKDKDYSYLISKVSITSCNCISEISTALPLSEKNKRIQGCMQEGLSNEVLNGEDQPTTVEEIKFFYKSLQKELVENCEAVKRVTFVDDEEKLNSYSYNEKAANFYNKGQTVYQQGKFKEAIRYYKKAVAIDKEFVFAWDNLGRAYRELNQFDKAIEAYKASLKVDSLNRTALMNMAVAYNYKKDFEHAIEYYELIKLYYPNDPESPYGLSLIYMQQEKWDKSLLSAIEAYKLYGLSKSPYQADAERIISHLYAEFKKRDRIEYFNKACADNDITLGF